MERGGQDKKKHWASGLSNIKKTWGWGGGGGGGGAGCYLAKKITSVWGIYFIY